MDILAFRQHIRTAVLQYFLTTVRQQQVLYDKKWMMFLRRAWLFRYVPFVEFVLAAGSMATGAVNSNSDFDVIVAAREGRIFTTRFFAVTLFGLFGWRRVRISHAGAARDKICLNHFITRSSFRLAPPHTDSWRALYRALVPLYGRRKCVAEFFHANADWMGERLVGHDLRYDYREPSLFVRFFIFLLSGFFGDYVERMLRAIQIWKIEYSMRRSPLGYKPRIRYADIELEFHPDRAKFE